MGHTRARYSLAKRAKGKGRWTQPWWRFDRYEFRDGYIRPAADAECTLYEPWDLYRASWAAKKQRKKRPATSRRASGRPTTRKQRI